MSERQSFWAELRRRNVFKAATAYVIVGWLLIQASDVIAPQLNLPEWAPRLVTFLIILGFPLALLLTWVFELTPQGVQVTDGQFGSKRFYAFVAAVTVLGLTWFALGSREESQPAVVVVAPGPPSIAVLAFENMSPERDNEFFADGISEEILNILAGIEGLRVASRTSAFSFKGEHRPVPEIGRILNVAHVLEGSVRRQGQRVRITAQLIRADADEHLWSQSYDRDLTDIFAVQEEIAQSIVDALGEVLGTRRVAVQAATEHLDAYDRFLRGRALFHERRDLDDAIYDLRHAVRQDPGFAEAWVYLAAAAYVSPGHPATRISDEEALALSRHAVERAEALMPEHPILLGILGAIRGDEGDHAAGFDLLARAAALTTQDSTPVLWHGLMLILAGYPEEAVPVLERAHIMDPRVGINSGYLGIAYLLTGREAMAETQARLAVEQGWSVGLRHFAYELAARGERARAAEILPEVFLPEINWPVSEEAFLAAILDPDQAEVYAALIGHLPAPEELRAMDRSGQFLDRVGEWIFVQSHFNRRWWLRSVWMPSASELREDPRFFAMAEHMGLVRLWEERGYPRGCARVSGADGDRLDCPGRRP